jgi:hypothetical protein
MTQQLLDSSPPVSAPSTTGRSPRRPGGGRLGGAMGAAARSRRGAAPRRALSPRAGAGPPPRCCAWGARRAPGTAAVAASAL